MATGTSKPKDDSIPPPPASNVSKAGVAADKVAESADMVRVVKVRTVNIHPMHCHTQDVLIPHHEFVRVELDSWVAAQIKAGLISTE